MQEQVGEISPVLLWIRFLLHHANMAKHQRIKIAVLVDRCNAG